MPPDCFLALLPHSCLASLFTLPHLHKTKVGVPLSARLQIPLHLAADNLTAQLAQLAQEPSWMKLGQGSQNVLILAGGMYGWRKQLWRVYTRRGNWWLCMCCLGNFGIPWIFLSWDNEEFVFLSVEINVCLIRLVSIKKFKKVVEIILYRRLWRLLKGFPW